MKFASALAILALASSTQVNAFSSLSPTTLRTATTTTALQAHKNTNNQQQANNSNPFVNFCATAAMTAFLWGAPAMVSEQMMVNHPSTTPTMVTRMLVDPSTIASAKEMASGTGSRVNKDPESLLRLGLPIKNKEVRWSWKRLYQVCFVWFYMFWTHFFLSTGTKPSGDIGNHQVRYRIKTKECSH